MKWGTKIDFCTPFASQIAESIASIDKLLFVSASSAAKNICQKKNGQTCNLYGRSPSSGWIYSCLAQPQLNISLGPAINQP